MIPAMTGARPFAASTVAATRSRYSSWSSVCPSPVEPPAAMPWLPAPISQSTWGATPLRSISPSLRNGVVIGGITPVGRIFMGSLPVAFPSAMGVFPICRQPYRSSTLCSSCGIGMAGHIIRATQDRYLRNAERFGATFAARSVAGGNLVLMRGERCRALRPSRASAPWRSPAFGRVQQRPRRILLAKSGDSRWASSRPSGVAPGLVAVNRKGPPETLQTHSVRMNLSPGSLCRFLVCHSRSCGFLDFWPTIWDLHDGVAEVIHDGRDRKDAAQPLIEILIGFGFLGLCVRVIRTRQNHWRCRHRQPGDHASSCDGTRNRPCHWFPPGWLDGGVVPSACALHAVRRQPIRPRMGAAEC